MGPQLSVGHVGAAAPGPSSRRRPEPSRRRKHPASRSGAHPATPGRPRRTPFSGTLTKTGTGRPKRRWDGQAADRRRTAARGQAATPSRGNGGATPVVSRGIGDARFLLAPVARDAINRCLPVTFTWAPQLPRNNQLHGTATIDLQSHLQPQRKEYNQDCSCDNNINPGPRLRLACIAWEAMSRACGGTRSGR